MKYSHLNKPRASWSKREQAGANQSQDLARAPKPSRSCLISLSKPSIWKPWLPDPDFHDLGRALESIIALFISFRHNHDVGSLGFQIQISMIWPRPLELILFLSVSLSKSSIWVPWLPQIQISMIWPGH